MKKFFDRFVERHGLWIAAVSLASLAVIAMYPFPPHLLGSLPLWAYVVAVVLIVLFSLFFYLKLKREKPNDKDKLVVSGE
jgi:4-hydroxybenzoate polyprenyltransferase